MIVLLSILSFLVLFFAYLYQQMKIRCIIAETKLKNHEELRDTFRLISTEALEKTNQTLYESSQMELDRKQQTICDMMDKLQQQIHFLEKERKIEHGVIKQQLHSLVETELQLKTETAKLVNALRSPSSRGKWGEMHLKRVVEFSGMQEYCDFVEQAYDTQEIIKKKPDLIIRLPGQRQVIIDAKVPLEAYLEALDLLDDNLRFDKLKLHARHVKDHILQLSKKNYWEHFQPTPEFVVLFLPSETIFAMAMEADPTLIEYGAKLSVILATPTTLIALLKTVAYGWKQDNLSRYAEKISDLGQEVYKHIFDFSSHWVHIRKSLDQTIHAYNRATRTLEKGILPSARQFAKFGVTSESQEVKELKTLDTPLCNLAAPELSAQEQKGDLY